MSSVSEIVAEILGARAGKVFGLMGHGNAWLLDALERQGNGSIAVRHEAAAVAAPDAYHRVSRNLAVGTTTFGPGFTNTLTALAEAAQANTPLVLVTGGPPSTGPRRFDVDQVGLAAAIGVPTFTLDQDTAITQTRRAVSHALEHRMPVVLTIPYDRANATVTEIAGPWEPERTPPQPVTQAAIDELIGLLRSARRPLLLAGRGARDGVTEVIALAELLECDVATTAPSRGFFSGGGGVRDLGTCGGFAAAGAAREIHRADLVLALGAGLNHFTLSFGDAFDPAATVAQVDLAQLPTSSRVDHFLSGRVEDIAPRLLAGLRQTGYRAKRRPRTGADPLALPVGPELAADGRLDPRALMTRINEILPGQRVIATDGGHFLGWAASYLTLHAPDQLVLLGTAFQAIGLGFSAAVGVAAAVDKRQVAVLITGDGGALMGLADAESFIRVAHRGVIIICNDAAYGAEVHQYAAKGLDQAPMLIPEVDFAGVLAGFGARTAVIRRLSDLADFAAWIRAGETGTYVLDCRISREVVAPFLEEMARNL